MNVSKQTAMDIALAYREVETAEELLASVSEALSRRELPDIRDAFGRQHGGLQLGVPHGQNGHRLYDVPWPLAKPIIEAHIAAKKAIIAALSETVRIEVGAQIAHDNTAHQRASTVNETQGKAGTDSE